MDKIRFNCPSCRAKLKVPGRLAGVTGPCPKCGAIIVAPLQSEIPAEEPAIAAASPSPAHSPYLHPPAARESPATPAYEAQPFYPAPQAVSPPAPTSVSPETSSTFAEFSPKTPWLPEDRSAPVKAQPVAQSPQPYPASPQQPYPAPPPQAFPRPYEQASHTAAVALANAPSKRNGHPPQVPPPEPHTPPPAGHAAPPPQRVLVPPPPDAARATTLPEPPSRAFLDLVTRTSAPLAEAHVIPDEAPPASPGESWDYPAGIAPPPPPHAPQTSAPPTGPGSAEPSYPHPGNQWEQVPYPTTDQPEAHPTEFPAEQPDSAEAYPSDSWADPATVSETSNDSMARPPTGPVYHPPTGQLDPTSFHSPGSGQNAPFSDGSTSASGGGVPKTQPIRVKRNTASDLPLPGGEEERSGGDLPRLDVSLAESNSQPVALPSPEHATSATGPTLIQLPPVGSESGRVQLGVSTEERPPYRPPQPVALTPPDAEPQTGSGPVVLPESKSSPVRESVETPSFASRESGTGEGSLAAFLEAAQTSHSPVSNVPLEDDQISMPAHLQQPRSKQEILDQLHQTEPYAPTQKKKGLSKTAVLMLSILSAVAVCASAGVYFALEKLGGFSVVDENVHGEQGLVNLEKRQATDSYVLPKSSSGGEAPETIEVPGPSASGETETEKRASLSASEIEKIAQSPDLGNRVATLTGMGPASSEPPSSAPQPRAIEPVAPKPESPRAILAQPVLPDDPGADDDGQSQSDDASNEGTASTSSKSNYNPKPFFPAPGPDDPPLTNTHDLVDAFLRAPTWRERLPYIYQGNSLAPAIEEYYKKWPDFSLDRFKMQYFQMELDPQYGGPFWVYQVSKSDADSSGSPLIIRVEDGNLKVDWEIFAEFADKHFIKFRQGEIPPPHNFRLVAERVSEYPGPDRVAFSEADDYLCYELNPPYGQYREYSEYAFIKKGTELANQFDAAVGLGDDPLAVIVTLDRKAFSHGIKHLVITRFVGEGWFRR